ncbi:MAG: hypothetical protein R3E77_03540 [Steroidobacteraceae bacterium]
MAKSEADSASVAVRSAEHIARSVAAFESSMHGLSDAFSEIATVAAMIRRLPDAKLLGERLAAAASHAAVCLQAHDRLVQELAIVCDELGRPIVGVPVSRTLRDVDAEAGRGSVELF